MPDARVTDFPSSSTREWWGEHELPDGAALRFRIGPCSISAESLVCEWRIGWAYAEDPLDPSLEIGVVGDVLEDAVAVHRFAFSCDIEKLALTPALADRPVVVNTLEPLHILPKSRAVLYVSTPLWVQLSVGGDRRPLCEVPSFPAADTWFGPSTRSGQLCYASRTRARLSARDVPMRPGRAVTPIVVDNAATEPLDLNKISVPAPTLPLHADAEGQLWTSPLRIERGEDGELGEVEVVSDLASHAGPTRQVNEPRQVVQRNALARALGSFLG